MDSTIKKRVGENVRRIRAERGIAADELAMELKSVGLNWNANRVYELERGNKTVSIPELIALAYSFSALNSPVKLSDLFEGEEPILLNEKMSITTSHMKEIFEGAPLGQGLKDWPMRRRQFMEATESVSPLSAEALMELGRFNEGGVNADSAASAYTSIGLAELKAAKALGLTMAELIGACLAIWGRTLTSERDSRAEGLRGQAKGHVTRELLDELREHIGKFNGND